MKTNDTTEVVTIDAAGRAPGRVASEAAKILMGKNRPDFQRHLEAGVRLKVVNADKLKISSAKASGKLYVSYSGYPGGQKLTTQTELLEHFNKSEVLKRAIYGMLPDNKLRPRLMKYLTITE